MTDTHATTTEARSALLASHRECFACGSCNDHGLGLRFELDADGTATAEWQPSAGFRSYPDRLHGGVIATMMDSAMVHALFARGIAGVTAELTVRYLRVVALTGPLRITGRVLSERHGLHICRADVHQNGCHAVRATAKFMPGNFPVPPESPPAADRGR